MTPPSTAPAVPPEPCRPDHPLLPLWRALAQIPDPCQQACAYELSIVDLGIVNGVVAEDGCVTVSLTFTEASCTFGFRIIEEIEDRLARIPGVHRVRVSIEPFPVWEPSRLTDRARRAHAESRLRFGPSRGAGGGAEVLVPMSTITMGGRHV
jgi:metal-sulfur cluster biosynthetic enzyme